MALTSEDVQVIRALSDRIAQESDETVRHLINRLEQVNTELDAAWDGPSKDAFDRTYGDWIEQLRGFSAALINVRQYLLSVAQNFEDLEAASGGSATEAKGYQ